MKVLWVDLWLRFQFETISIESRTHKRDTQNNQESRKVNPGNKQNITESLRIF